MYRFEKILPEFEEFSYHSDRGWPIVGRSSRPHRLTPTYSPSLHSETLSGAVDGVFRDRVHRRRTRLSGPGVFPATRCPSSTSAGWPPRWVISMTTMYATCCGITQRRVGHASGCSTPTEGYANGEQGRCSPARTGWRAGPAILTATATIIWSGATRPMAVYVYG